MSIRWIFVAALFFPALGLAASGKVVHVENEVTVEQAGKWIPVKAGMDVVASAATTGAEGRLQLLMADGSLIALPPNSEIRFPNASGLNLSLIRGGLRLVTSTPQIFWLVQVLGRNIRASGYLKLQTCMEDCALAPGLYGRVGVGEAIVEYEGGRSVLKGKAFRLSSTGGKPEILLKAPSLLDDIPDYQQVDKARAEITKRLTQGEEAFRAGNFAAAKKHLEAVQAAAPSESVVSYYLGLIALESQKNDEALRLLQKYMKEDTQAAIERDVPKTITLLSTHQLQEEVTSAIAQEKSLSTAPPEPNSIAVQTFASRGDPIYRAMAKGIAAMIIADLAQVPGLKVLEREKVQKLMAEMRLGESGLAETSTAVRAGRMMRAEKVIVGSFGSRNDE